MLCFSFIYTPLKIHFQCGLQNKVLHLNLYLEKNSKLLKYIIGNIILFSPLTLKHHNNLFIPSSFLKKTTFIENKFSQ